MKQIYLPEWAIPIITEVLDSYLNDNHGMGVKRSKMIKEALQAFEAAVEDSH